MKTETEIILALENLKKAYQLKLKNIETAITCISTASMIVDAVKTCHVKQLKEKLNKQQAPPAPPVPPVPPADRIQSDGKALIPPPLQVDHQEVKPALCAECGKKFIKITSRLYCSKQCASKVKNRNYLAKQKLKIAQVPSPGTSVPEIQPVVPDPDPIPVPTIIDKKYDPEQLKQKLDKIKRDIPIKRDRPAVEHYF